MVRRFTPQARAASEMLRVTAAGLGVGSAGASSGDGTWGGGVVDASVAVAAVPVVGAGAPVGSKGFAPSLRTTAREGIIIMPRFHHQGQGGPARTPGEAIIGAKVGVFIAGAAPVYPTF